MPLRLGGHILKRIEEERTTDREFRTTDMGLASFLFYNNVPLVSVSYGTPQLYTFESPNPWLFLMWQKGSVNGLGYWRAYQALKVRAFEHSKS